MLISQKVYPIYTSLEMIPKWILILRPLVQSACRYDLPFRSLHVSGMSGKCSEMSEFRLWCSQTWQFCRYKIQFGPQVLNELAQILPLAGVVLGERQKMFGNRANGSDSRSIWMSGTYDIMISVWTRQMTSSGVKGLNMNWIGTCGVFLLHNR
jgi:hypothetical protein